MATPTPKSPKDVDGSREQMGYVLSAAQHVLDEQTAVSDRLENKARQQVVVTGTFFTVGQATAIGVLTRASFDSELGPWIVRAAVAAGLLMFATFLLATWAVRNVDESFVSATKIKKDWLSYAYDGHPIIGHHLAELTLQVAEKRETSNERRSTRTTKTLIASAVTVAVIGIELVLTLIAVLG